jgi:hypothetical protein
MKNLFGKIFRNLPKPVPETIQNELHRNFPNAINVEWEPKKNFYEAVFYLDDVEHIAHLSEPGKLTEFKKNLWPAELPEAIAAESRQYGEIMNSIAIFRQEDRFFEVIIRDKQFRRKLLLFDESANLLNSEKL